MRWPRALLVAVTALTLAAMRTYERSEELITTRDGRMLTVSRLQSGWRSLGARHGFAPGRALDYRRLRIDADDGSSFVWSHVGDCVPFVAEYVARVAYVACHEPRYGHERFRLFASVGADFIEVQRDAFPAGLRQNTGMQGWTDDEKEANREQVPWSLTFRRSLTASLWFYLKTGESSREVGKMFLADYKRALVEPVALSPAQARGLPIVSCEALRKNPLVGALVCIREKVTAGHLGTEACDGDLYIDDGLLLDEAMRGIAERDLAERKCDPCELRHLSEWFVAEIELCFSIRHAIPKDHTNDFHVNGRRPIERDGLDVAVTQLFQMSYTYLDRRGGGEVFETRTLGAQP